MGIIDNVKIMKDIKEKELKARNVHHGHNIRRTCLEKSINQDVLSTMVNLSQPAISKYENTRIIDDEMLQRFARALKAPMEYLKNLEENAPSVVFENNTMNNNDQQGGASTASSYVEYPTTTANNINPIDKVTELYERLLKEKDEKYAALERRLERLEQNSQK